MYLKNKLLQVLLFFVHFKRFFGYAYCLPQDRPFFVCLQKVVHIFSLWRKFEAITSSYYAKVLDFDHFWTIFEGFLVTSSAALEPRTPFCTGRKPFMH